MIENNLDIANPYTCTSGFDPSLKYFYTVSQQSKQFVKKLKLI